MVEQLEAKVGQEPWGQAGGFNGFRFRRQKGGRKQSRWRLRLPRSLAVLSFNV
jgi:hypothetical protein